MQLASKDLQRYIVNSPSMGVESNKRRRRRSKHQVLIGLFFGLKLREVSRWRECSSGAYILSWWGEREKLEWVHMIHACLGFFEEGSQEILRGSEERRVRRIDLIGVGRDQCLHL